MSTFQITSKKSSEDEASKAPNDFMAVIGFIYSFMIFKVLNSTKSTVFTAPVETPTNKYCDESSRHVTIESSESIAFKLSFEPENASQTKKKGSLQFNAKLSLGSLII